MTARWLEVPVCVAGIGVSGYAAAETLVRLGARVTVVDGRDGQAEREKAAALRLRGAEVVLGDAESLPAGTGLVVTSPGWRPDSPLPRAAAAADVPVWGEVELAWRLRPARGAAPWLCLTGTNGKTTTVRMLTAILTAAGHRAVAAGNVGLPVLEAVRADPPYDVIAVELSSFQLHWSQTLAPLASAVLNLAPDHLDWHGGLAGYAADKARVYDRALVRVYNADDEATERMARVAAAEAGERADAARFATHGAARLVGFTLGEPGPGQLGVVGGWLVDRAFGQTAGASAGVGAGGVRLAPVAEVRPPGAHNVANALAAAALGRAFGVPAEAVRAGLRAFEPDRHRVAVVGEVGGVTYVDDSKATNGHAAAASLSAFEPVVWIAGGLAKGARFDDLVRAVAGRLRGVVLLGRDRGLFRDALARHAPRIPVVEVSATDTGAMRTVVDAAAGLAQPGDTVLLAPACASMDMFPNYAARGDAFAEAVRALESRTQSAGTPR